MSVEDFLDTNVFESGCVRLYSEDLQHGQRIESLTIENPFQV